MAHLLSNTLYSKRNFPYLSFCILGGLDENGESNHITSIFVFVNVCMTSNSAFGTELLYLQVVVLFINMTV